MKTKLSFDEWKELNPVQVTNEAIIDASLYPDIADKINEAIELEYQVGYREYIRKFEENNS